MTIPSKGGRPHKWRSDADRVGAFRARQRGDNEPATLDQALDDGDEFVAVRQLSHDLAGRLAESQPARSQLREELAAERRQRESADRRVMRLREEVVRLEVRSMSSSEPSQMTATRKRPNDPALITTGRHPLRRFGDHRNHRSDPTEHNDVAPSAKRDDRHRSDESLWLIPGDPAVTRESPAFGCAA